MQIFAYFFLIKLPFDAEARIAHESLAREVVTEFNLRADMQVRAFEPLPDLIPELRLRNENEGLLCGVSLSPDIRKAGERQSRRGAEILAFPDKSELQRRLIMRLVEIIYYIFI